MLNTTEKQEPRTLPLKWGAALHVHGGEHDQFLTVSVSQFGERRDLGGAPLDAVVRFLAPECGFTVTDDANGTRYRTEGPVCVGGPYDGKRIGKQGFPSGRIRVPVFEPMFFRHVPEPDEFGPLYSEGEYVLTALRMGERDKPPQLADERELWWWVPPKKGGR